MYFSRSSSGLPLSGKTLAMASKIFIGGNKFFAAKLRSSTVSENKNRHAVTNNNVQVKLRRTVIMRGRS